MTEIDIMDRGNVISRIYAGDDIVPDEYLKDYPEIFVVYDRNVEPLALRYASGCGAAVKGTYPVRATEENKTMSTVLGICGWLLREGAGRKALLLAVGGGITTDMAGFAASVYKRGIRFAYVPTTLLAQVDAAIGGKTGVNLDSYKNMLGVIRQPECTFLTLAPLMTLPFRDFLSGAAEMLKTFIISDNGRYGRALSFLKELRMYMTGVSDSESGPGVPMEERYSEFLHSRRDELSALVASAASVKAAVVSADQFESGERRKLNLGHTFAHAIEWYERTWADSGQGPSYSHGEAVSVGIMYAALLSEAAGVAPAGLYERLKRDFSASGLPVSCPFPLRRLAEAMSKDKKAEGKAVHFILIEDIGRTVEKDMTVADAIALLQSHGGGDLL